MEALITALVFDHSLRIRLKADVESESKDGEAKSTKSNLVGRINNLVTGDLEAIGQGQDFLSLCTSAFASLEFCDHVNHEMTVVSVPFQVVLSTWFLYTLLGWR